VWELDIERTTASEEKKKRDLELRVRKARRSDREAVFNFCRKTWSWGDYIQEVWDSWLEDSEGRVFVATVDDVPVGVSYVSIDKPKEAWLRGARTDPNYRRMGIAEAIAKRCLQYVGEKGVKTARLVTDSDNVAAQALLKKLGFSPVAEFAEAGCRRFADEASGGVSWAARADLERLWQYLRRSEAYRKSAGLYTALFHWFSLDKKDLAGFINQQKAIVHTDANGGFDGLILTDDATATQWQKNTMQTCYIGGTCDAVTDMARFLKSYCHAKKIKKIYAFTCNHQPITTALEALGFKLPKKTEIVYEKPVLGPRRRRRSANPSGGSRCP